MTALPKGWDRCLLDEINDPERPICYGILMPGPDLPTGVPYVKVRNIRDERVLLDQVHRTSVAIDEKYARSRLRTGDLLVSIRGTYGRTAAVPPELDGGNITQDTARVAPVGMYPPYVLRFLQGPQAQGYFKTVARGVAVKGVNIGDLRKLPVTVPPLAEQERVVAAIDEAFSKVDAGEAGLRTVRQLLKRMREAVLAAAVTGRLVPQDRADTPATQLLADLAIDPHEGHELSALPDGWCWSTLGEVSFSAGYGTSVKCDYSAAGAGVLRIPNIQRGRIDLSDLKRAPEGATPDELLLAPGDLLIVRTNGSRELVGRSAPVTRDTSCSFASYLIRFRLNSAVVDAEYVSLMLSSPAWRQMLEDSAASSAGQYNLSLRTLQPMLVAVPPLEEQRRIVAAVERQLSSVEACERAVDTGLARAAALRRSVLKAAFEGRLVPHDPSEEPASGLLERIRVERAARDGSGGERRRKKVEAS